MVIGVNRVNCIFYHFEGSYIKSINEAIDIFVLEVIFDRDGENVIECATVFFVITLCSAKNVPTAKRFLDLYCIYT